MIVLILSYQASKKAKEELQKQAAAKKKAGPIAKSLVVYDVKPYDADTDLDGLAKEILKIE